jgi:hypothetical protein
MLTSRLKLAFALAATLNCALPSPSAAQTPAQTPRNKTPPGIVKHDKTDGARDARDAEDLTNKLLQMRVVEVLRRTADESKQWEKKDVAAKVQVRAADLLWDADADAARAILSQAWETASKVEEPEREHSQYRNYSRRAEIRREVLLVAKRRDDGLAKKWLDELSQEKEGERDNGGRGVFDDRTARSTVLLQMALASAKDNPSAATDFAIESLRDGISFGLQNVLIALQEQSFDLAESVFRAALNRLATVGMTDPNELLILHSYLYSPGKIRSANTTDNQGQITLAVGRSPVTITPAAQFKPALAADFLKLATDLLLSAPLPSASADPQSNARAQISVIEALIGRVEQLSPEKGAQLATRLQTLLADAQFTPQPPAPPDGFIEPHQGEKASEYNQRRVDHLEELAEQESGTLRKDIAFAKAAAATEVEAYERGWRVAGRISDKELRAGVTNWLTYRATLHFIEKKDFEKSYALNSRNEDTAQRAVCLIAGAQKLVEAKDTARADEWLREAIRLMKKSQADEAWAKIALGIVAAYGKFDPNAAVSSLQDAVKLANQSPLDLSNTDAAPPLQRFSGIITLDAAFATRGFSLEAAIAGFGPRDFESVYGVLKDMQTPEARGLAVITLCQQFTKNRDARAKEPSRTQPPKPTS